MAENSAMNIVEFLEARIAEDEALAQAAIDQHAPEEWESELGSMNLWPEDIAFWAKQTPPRVLAECAAKRAIIEQHQTYVKAAAESVGIAFIGARGGQEVTGDVLKVFASVYRDHPDYQEDWDL